MRVGRISTEGEPVHPRFDSTGENKDCMTARGVMMW